MHRALFPQVLLSLFVTLPVLAQGNVRPNLEIYWIDTEGGASTLIVSPSGESLLFDTGFPAPSSTGETDRDARRILAAAQNAGLTRIDHMVISHFHADHVGGLAALSKLIPLGHVYSRSDFQLEPANRQWFDAVQTASGGKTTFLKAGDTVPIKGLDVLVVASDGKMLNRTLSGGGPNPLCATAENKAAAGPENQNVMGLRIGLGNFSMLALIDLDWAKEMELACPINKLGKITIYQSGRHGSFDGSGAPALLNAIRPQVVVVNNGPRKGMGQVDATVKSTTGDRPYEKNAFLRMASIPGVEGIWQLHKSLLDPDPKHNTAADMTANFEESADCSGNWIKASVASNGSFTVFNGRNGFSKNYRARK